MADLDDLDDEVFDDALSDLERKRRLEMKRTKGVRVEVDLSENTPLREYYDHRRSRCINALQQLVAVDATRAADVIRLQASIQEFLSFRGWIRETVEDSLRADEELQGKTRGQDPDSD